MSVFKSVWIILKIEDREKQYFLTIFTQEFWKIKVVSKKAKLQKTLDIWYNINYEIIVKKSNSLNTILNINIKNQFNYNKFNYEIILEYLNLIKIIYNFCPLNHKINWIYEIVNELNSFKNITEEKIIFLQLKILNVLWILNTNNDNLKIQKILLFIQNNNIWNILKLKWLKLWDKQELKQIINN